MVITRPTFDGAPARPYQCSPFDFALSVLPYGVSSREQRNALTQEQQAPTTIAEMEHMKWQVDTGVVSLAQLNEQLLPPQLEKRDNPAALSLSPCVGVAFEQIPATLNSKRFLYSDPVINYQSDNFLVPLDGAILTEREILIVAKEESVLRVYTEVILLLLLFFTWTTRSRIPYRLRLSTVLPPGRHRLEALHGQRHQPGLHARHFGLQRYLQ